MTCIGNSPDGESPFGIVADLRIYPYLFKGDKLDQLAIYHPLLEKEMPDKYIVYFLQQQIPHYFISKIQESAEDTIDIIL